jgi:hypothetical protein
MTETAKTEAELQSQINEWFESIELPFVRHPTLDNGSVPDFGLMLSDGITPWALIEIKLGLSLSTLTVKDAADYFEQCLKYRLVTNLPVFLGPFFVNNFSISHFFCGGSKSSAVAAFSALAGRADVGLFFIKENNFDYPRKWSGLVLTMRQFKVVRYEFNHDKYNVYPESKIKMVAINNAASKKVRE